MLLSSLGRQLRKCLFRNFHRLDATVDVLQRRHMTPNRINRTLLATKENSFKKNQIYMFSAHGTIDLKRTQMRPGAFLPTNQDLGDILGRTDFHSDHFDFLICGIPDSQISRFLDF